MVVTDTGGYREQANGIAERRIQSLFQIVRALLLQAGSGNIIKQVWDEAAMHANALFNNTEREVPGQASKITPHEVKSQENHKNNVSKWPPWGCKAIYFVPKQKREDKLDQVAQLGIFVGFDSVTVGGYRLVPVSFENGEWKMGPTVVAVRVRLFEEIFPLRGKSSSTVPLDFPVDVPTGSSERDTPREWVDDDGDDGVDDDDSNALVPKRRMRKKTLLDDVDFLPKRQRVGVAQLEIESESESEA